MHSLYTHNFFLQNTYDSIRILKIKKICKTLRYQKTNENKKLFYIASKRLIEFRLKVKKYWNNDNTMFLLIGL